VQLDRLFLLLAALLGHQLLPRGMIHLSWVWRK
jgi:hypothetical protein